MRTKQKIEILVPRSLVLHRLSVAFITSEQCSLHGDGKIMEENNDLEANANEI